MAPSDFDRIIDRRGSDALAIDGYSKYLFGDPDIRSSRFEDDDLIPLWVADMQFATAPCIVDALKARTNHPIFGYSIDSGDDLFQSFAGWTQSEYGWRITRDTFFVTLGVIPALFDLVEMTCAGGGKVLTLAPAYGYFKHAATRLGNEIVCAPLVRGAQYELDFDDFRSKARDQDVRLFFLCYPHNPTGRQWRIDELRRLVEICIDNDIVIVSDEIHCDLLRVGKTHTPLAKLFPDCDRIVTCMGPSKTFNLAGLMTGFMLTENAEIQGRMRDRHMPFVSPFGVEGAKAAYSNGRDWLSKLRAYLDENFRFLQDFLSEYLPDAAFQIPDATYLAWIDLGAYFPDETNLTRFFLERAGVIVEGGEMFVENGARHIRINVACPRSVLRAALDRIAKAVNEQ